MKMLTATRGRGALLISLLLFAGLTASPSSASGAGSGEVTRSTEQLTPKEMLSRAEAVLAKLKASLKEISGKITEARKSKDTVLLYCLTDKLAMQNSNTKIGEARWTSLVQAVSYHENEWAADELNMLQLIEARSEKIASEANACVGGEKKELATVEATPVADEFPEFLDISTEPSPPIYHDRPPDYEWDYRRSSDIEELRAVGLIGSSQEVSGAQFNAAVSAYYHLSRERLNQLRQDVNDSKKETRMRTDAQGLSDESKARSDVFLGRNWIDRDGYVVQLSSKVLTPDPRTITKVEYTYRAEGPFAGNSIFSNRVSFNRALPTDWGLIYNRDLNDAANLGGGSPEFWRTSQQVSFFSPGGSGCQICFSKQYLSPQYISPGNFGQARQESIRFNGVANSPLPGDLLVQQFDAFGALQSGSPTLSLATVASPSSTSTPGKLNYTYDDGTSHPFLTLDAKGLADLGRTSVDLDGSSWAGLRASVAAMGSSQYIDLKLTPIGSTNLVHLLISPKAFLEAF